jgi:putative transposase
VDDLVISLSAKGLTTGEISAHLAEIYGAEVSTQTISAITDRVMDGMAEWQNRPLDAVYPVVFIDCINVKIREGNVANRPIYLALAVTAEGTRDVLGLWAGEHGEGEGEGAKYWLRVLSEIKNRGVADELMLVCDGLKRLPDAVGQVWPRTVVHLHRAPAAQQLPLRLQKGLGDDRQRPQTGLHRAVRAGRAGPVRRVLRDMGDEIPGDHPVVDQMPGRSSCRSWHSTPRSARSSAPPTRSSPSTPASAARSTPAGISPPSRPHSSASTWPS